MSYRFRLGEGGYVWEGLRVVDGLNVLEMEREGGRCVLRGLKFVVGGVFELRGPYVEVPCGLFEWVAWRLLHMEGRGGFGVRGEGEGGYVVEFWFPCGWWEVEGVLGGVAAFGLGRGWVSAFLAFPAPPPDLGEYETRRYGPELAGGVAFGRLPAGGRPLGCGDGYVEGRVVYTVWEDGLEELVEVWHGPYLDPEEGLVLRMGRRAAGCRVERLRLRFGGLYEAEGVEIPCGLYEYVLHRLLSVENRTPFRALHVRRVERVESRLDGLRRVDDGQVYVDGVELSYRFCCMEPEVLQALYPLAGQGIAGGWARYRLAPPTHRPQVEEYGGRRILCRVLELVRGRLGEVPTPEACRRAEE